MCQFSLVWGGSLVVVLKTLVISILCQTCETTGFRRPSFDYSDLLADQHYAAHDYCTRIR